MDFKEEAGKVQVDKKEQASGPPRKQRDPEGGV